MDVAIAHAALRARNRLPLAAASPPAFEHVLASASYSAKWLGASRSHASIRPLQRIARAARRPPLRPAFKPASTSRLRAATRARTEGAAARWKIRASETSRHHPRCSGRITTRGHRARYGCLKLHAAFSHPLSRIVGLRLCVTPQGWQQRCHPPRGVCVPHRCMLTQTHSHQSLRARLLFFAPSLT